MLREVGRGFFLDVALHRDLAELLAQPRELFALGRGEAGLALRPVRPSSFDPEPQSGLGQVEIASDLGMVLPSSRMRRTAPTLNSSVNDLRERRDNGFAGFDSWSMLDTDVLRALQHVVEHVAPPVQERKHPRARRGPCRSAAGPGSPRPEAASAVRNVGGTAFPVHSEKPQAVGPWRGPAFRGPVTEFEARSCHRRGVAEGTLRQPGGTATVPPLLTTVRNNGTRSF